MSTSKIVHRPASFANIEHVGRTIGMLEQIKTIKGNFSKSDTPD